MRININKSREYIIIFNDNDFKFEFIINNFNDLDLETLFILELAHFFIYYIDNIIFINDVNESIQFINLIIFDDIY